MDQQQYATLNDFGDNAPPWIPVEERERIASYLQYDDMYWSAPESFEISMADEEESPIFVPKARTVVDTTSHFLLKGLTITAPDSAAPLQKALKDFMDRENFLTTFHVAKHSGVTRGDYLLHIMADKNKPEGSKLKLVSVHPANYFPVYDEWDTTKLVRVHLAEEFKLASDPNKTALRRLTYEYVQVNGTRRVQRTEGVFETQDWFDPTKQRQLKNLLKAELLPEAITHIPVYHFKNSQWQGRDFGTSELAGFERLLTAINQTITDEELALALEGLGVYYTDAAGPVDKDGHTLPWEVAPARVMEVPTGSVFARVKGVGSVTPMLDHVKYMQEALFEASGTSDIARGIVDVQVAQSGIALALRFLPTLAKIEERDRSGLDTLRQFWYDWKAWHDEFEGTNFVNTELTVEIGDKLPSDRTATLNELNNMLDRKVISRKHYRREAVSLGYTFPDDIDKEIDAEAQQAFEMAQKTAALTQPAPGQDPGAGKSGVQGRPPGVIGKPAVTNKSNNKARPNESGGTEAK